MKSLLTITTIVALAPCAHDVIGVSAQQHSESTGSFELISRVLSSPRCANCHFEGDSPAEGDNGRIHAMVVRRGQDGRGTPAMRCTNCHQDTSLAVPHAPPGAPDWRLPPTAMPMAWKGLTVSAQCRMLKDPSKNGNKTVQQLVDHMSHDPLVLASWNPGPGRMAPPMSHAAFVEAVKIWADGGAPCPDE
jgi:hypothetical protein